jgi:hypothetical protein
VVAALALGNTVGQTVVAVPLVLAARRIRGPEAVTGTGRAALAGAAAGLAGAAAGVVISLALPANDKLLATGVAVLAAVSAVLAFGLVADLLNDGDLRAATSWLRQVTRRVPDGALFLSAPIPPRPPRGEGRRNPARRPPRVPRRSPRARSLGGRCRVRRPRVVRISLNPNRPIHTDRR